ncbi:MAG: hypothetical protein HY805_08790 [Nitrospirae bacterium]|nr:hypothetical protein [Nitrospirota bacterium]
METDKVYPVFLSSVCKPEEMDKLREDIFKVGEEKYIYVDEKVKPRNIEQTVPLESVDDLIQRIREARVFVCILGGTRRGTDIEINKNISSISFFEIELFLSALMGKPVHFFIRNDYVPDPRLSDLLTIVESSLPEWISKKCDDSQIIEHCRRLANRERPTSPFRSLRHIYPPVRRFVQGLYTARRRNKIRFLAEEYVSRHSQPDRHLLQNISELIHTQPNEERRLARLFIGIWELMAAPYSTCSDLELLQYWNALLSEWSKAGAWYGLHADTPLGCLAALNSVTKVREHLKKQGSVLKPSDIGYPGGALASAKYSIAKRLIKKQDRERRFHEALNDLDIAMQLPESDEAGLRAIRGSIYRQLGNITEAISEYETVLNLRQSCGANLSAIGEAMSELGYAYLKRFHFNKGLDYCREGVSLLRSGTRPGFLVRGLRKLAVAYLCNGKLIKAFDIKEEAKKLATEHGAFDQL